MTSGWTNIGKNKIAKLIQEVDLRDESDPDFVKRVAILVENHDDSEETDTITFDIHLQENH